MSETSANRIRFLFFCLIQKAAQVYCCSLKMGSYILTILIFLIKIFLFFIKNKISSNEFYIAHFCVCLIIFVLFIISIAKFDYNIANFVWILDTIIFYFNVIYYTSVMSTLFKYGYKTGDKIDLILIIYGVCLTFALIISLYFNYIVYSVTKTIGLKEFSVLDLDDPEITSQELSKIFDFKKGINNSSLTDSVSQANPQSELFRKNRDFSEI